MIPKFTDELAWQQAEFLMQPIYIRIIDRIRQHSEVSTWEASYIEAEIPHPTHYLCLISNDRLVKFEIWDLCYRVCFLDYAGSSNDLESELVAVDTSLIDLDAGAVNWQRLDDKADRVIASIFASLPQ
jgi:hypothetical protein